jgi:hypothetical protein
VSYPASALKHRIEIAPGADLTSDPATYAWQDITSDWYGRDGIEHKRGCEDEQGAGSTSLKFSLKNPDGEYSIDNCESTLYGYLEPGELPIRHSIDLDDEVGWRQRCVQFLESVENDWPAGTPLLCIAKVEARGLFQRLGAGRAVKSPLVRRILSGLYGGPVVYWPLIDGRNAQDGSSAMALPGSASVINAIKWAEIVGPIGAPESLPELVAPVGVEALGMAIPPGSGTVWTLGMIMKAKLSGADGATVPLTWWSKGECREWSLYTSVSGEVSTIEVVGFDTNETTPIEISVTGYNLLDDEWHTIHVRIIDFEGTLTVQLFFDGDLIGNDTAVSAAGEASEVSVWTTPEAQFSSVSIGHVTIQKGVFNASDIYDAMLGHAGELAHVRWARVCSENGVPYSVVGTSNMTMGPQPTTRLLDILRDIEQTDHGIADDSQGVAGYRVLADMCAVEPTLTIDGGARQLGLPFTPKRDTQGVYTRVTASRPGGGSATVEDSVAIAAGKLIETDINVNPASDVDLIRHAELALARAGAREGRYPEISVDLLVAPVLATDWCDLTLGDRLTITSPPRQHRKGDVNQQVRGWTEAYAGNCRGWAVTHNTVPYFPVYSTGDDAARRDAEYSALMVEAVEVDPGDTQTTQVETLQGEPWSLDAIHYPVAGRLGGERVSVLGAMHARQDRFNRTVETGWGTAESGQAWSTSGGAAGDYYVAGV